MSYGDLLAGVPLFDGLSDDDRNALAERLEHVTLSAGEKVFVKGDAGASMYIVLSGAVQVYLGSEEEGLSRVVLKDLRTGEYFGELSLFDDKPRSASVEVLVDAVLLKLTREEFTAQLTVSRSAALGILSEMAQRLRETNAMLSQRAATNVVKEIEDNLTWGQRLADRVARWNGSWMFILFVITLSLGWTIINQQPSVKFDAYPYAFYNLALSILIALQGPLIVMSQNRDTTKDRAKAEADFRVNLKKEIGIEAFARNLSAFRAEAEVRLDAVERTQLRKQKAAAEEG